MELTRSGFNILGIAYASIENPKLQVEQILGVSKARGRIVREKYFPENIPLPPPTCILTQV